MTVEDMAAVVGATLEVVLGDAGYEEIDDVDLGLIVEGVAERVGVSA